MSRPAKPVEERFEAKVERCPMSGCWLWSDAPDQDGYGRLGLSGPRTIKAHRLSFELHIGHVPDGLQVLHRCDTPACVNPAHLFLGTHADNMADMDAKGRRRNVAPYNPVRGSDRPDARLTEEVVADARARLAAGERFHQGQLARALGVRQSTLSRAINGVTWRHVSATTPA